MEYAKHWPCRPKGLPHTLWFDLVTKGQFQSYKCFLQIHHRATSYVFPHIHTNDKQQERKETWNFESHVQSNPRESWVHTIKKKWMKIKRSQTLLATIFWTLKVEAPTYNSIEIEPICCVKN